MTDVDRAYLAGLLDGEGTVMIYRQTSNAQLRIVVSNTFIPVVNWCCEVTGVGFVRVEDREAKGHRSIARWITSMQPAAAVLRQLQPYLKIKAVHAELGIAFVERFLACAHDADKAWQEEMRLRLVALNARSSPRAAT